MAGKAKSTAAPPPGVLTQVPEWASTTAIAQLIGRSTRRVQQLTQDGVLSTEVPPGGGARRYRTARTIQDYMAWQEQKVRDELSGSTLEELTIKKLQAEVELKESQGALHKLKTAIAEGKYLPAEQVQGDLSDFLRRLKQFADRIPARVAGTMSGYLDTAAARAMKKDLQQELDGLFEAFVAAAHIQDTGREDDDPP